MNAKHAFVTALGIAGGADGTLGAVWRESSAGLWAIGIFSVFINVLRLATPLYVLQLLDRVVASGSMETLVMLTVIALVAVVTCVLLEVIRRRMLVHWGSWIEHMLGPRLFAAGVDKTLGQSPAASKMLRDVGTIRSFVSGTGIIAWLDVAWAPLFVGIVFLISPLLAYVVILAELITLGLGTASELLTRNYRNATFKAAKDDRDWVSSAERHRDTVGSLNMAVNLAERWARSASERLSEGVRARTLHIYFESAMRVVDRCLRIAILGVGVWLVIAQDLTLGAVIAANLLGRTSYSLVQSAMFKWRDMVMAKNAFIRIRTWLAKDTRKSVSAPDGNDRVPLYLENISFRYPGQNASVFRGITLTVQPGEAVCVIGQSAAGKTTFTRLVSGLVAPRAGKVRLGNVDVARLQQHGNARDIGNLPQEVTLFPGTVRQNIARMADGNIGRVIRAAKRAGIHDTILKLPEGYDTEISDNEPLLSAGQRKGIAVARAYYGSPRLIVLDEPTPHLDERARRALYRAIVRWKRKGTIVVVTTQSHELGKIADKVILLKGDRHEVLRSDKEVMAFRRNSVKGHESGTVKDLGAESVERVSV